jgi:RNA methyltransferase, TrmH family
MPVRIVQSKQNARLKDLRRALAGPGRKAGELAGIEGRNLVVEALRARLSVRCVFVPQGAERLLEGLGLPRGTEILIVPKSVLHSALATEAPQPMAALVEPFDWTWRDLLESDKGRLPLFLVLAGLQDPGNLGTLVRSAEAFGASGLVSLPGTVSAWNPKAVRASAGSVFRVPVLPASVEECFRTLRDHQVAIWATRAREAESAEQVDLRGPIALVIGNEGNGVPEEIAAQAVGAVTIPCPGPVESLNAAMAASVLLYEAERQRATSDCHPFPTAARRSGKWMGHGANKPARSRR